MKTLRTLLLVISMVAYYSLSAQMAITTDGSSADGSAMLEVKSTNKGFLMPRLTQAEIFTITNPANGLIVFCTTDDMFYAYILASDEWKEIPFGVRKLVSTVTNPTTGEIWMDRNLGASQVATSSNDADAYGDLYQWGRAADGHESRTSGTTTTLSTTDTPGHGDFIISGNYPIDWRSPQNDDLWQVETGINNPCPIGFRLPTMDEWLAEKESWSSKNAAGAFSSVLKLPYTGSRNSSDGTINMEGFNGIQGLYWSSDIESNMVHALGFDVSQFSHLGEYRAMGISVRCIKE